MTRAENIRRFQQWSDRLKSAADRGDVDAVRALIAENRAEREQREADEAARKRRRWCRRGR